METCFTLKNFLLKYLNDYFSEELGYVEPPKVFENRGIRGYRQNFVYQ